MLKCKLQQSKSESFVQDVKAAPHLVQLDDMDYQQSCLWNFNLGNLYVTPTTYAHLMLNDITTGQLLGPILVRQSVLCQHSRWI